MNSYTKEIDRLLKYNNDIVFYHDVYCNSTFGVILLVFKQASLQNEGEFHEMEDVIQACVDMTSRYLFYNEEVQKITLEICLDREDFYETLYLKYIIEKERAKVTVRKVKPTETDDEQLKVITYECTM